MQRERFDGMAEESKTLDLMKMRMVIKRKMVNDIGSERIKSEIG